MFLLVRSYYKPEINRDCLSLKQIVLGVKRKVQSANYFTLCTLYFGFVL